MSNKVGLLLQLLDVLDECLSVLVGHGGPVGEEHQPLVGLHLHTGQEDHQGKVEHSNTLK